MLYIPGSIIHLKNQLKERSFSQSEKFNIVNFNLTRKIQQNIPSSGLLNVKVLIIC